MTPRQGIWRRRALLALAAGLPSWQGLAATTEKVVVATSSAMQVSSIDVLNAAAGDHFAAHGLEAEVVSTGAASVALQLLVAGQVQMARTPGLELLRVMATGKARLLSVGCIGQDIDATIVSARDRPVSDLASLRGRRVGVRAIRSNDELLLDLLARAGGFAPAEIERQVVSAQPAAFTVVAERRLDAVVVSEEVALMMKLAGMDMLSWPMRLTLRLPGQCCVVTEQLARGRPALVRAMMGAMRDSMTEILALSDHAALFRRAAARFDGLRLRAATIDEAVVRLSAGGWTMRGRDRLLHHDAADWQESVRMLVANGFAPALDAAVATTDAFLD